MTELRFTGVVAFEAEDGHCALIATIGDDGEEHDQMFVRLQSWDETGVHPQARPFEGQQVEVIVRTLAPSVEVP